LAESWPSTEVAFPPYCASPQVATAPVVVSAAKENPFLGLKVGELRMDAVLCGLMVG
jgi:hypothetical protein